MIHRLRIPIALLLFSLVFAYGIPQVAHADFEINFENKAAPEKGSSNIMKQVNAAGGKAGLSAEDPRVYVAAGIKVILSVTGMLFLALIVFAGYVRVTAQGDEDRVKKSNSTAVAAVLGLAIVVMAYGVTLFVTSRLYNATTYEPVYDEDNEHIDSQYQKSIQLEVF